MTPNAYVALALTYGGIDIIYNQIKLNPLSISQADLCTLVEIDEARFVTLLQLLTMLINGQKALMILLKHNPQILTPEAMNHTYPLWERLEMHSPFAVLASTPFGRKVLKIIIMNNPTIITESTLNHSTDALNLSGGLTPAAILSCYIEGVEILTALAQEGILMLSNTLLFPHTPADNIRCVLYQLTTFPNGLALIKTMLHKRYESITKVELAILNTINPLSANVIQELKSFISRGIDDPMMPQANPFEVYAGLRDSSGAKKHHASNSPSNLF